MNILNYKISRFELIPTTLLLSSERYLYDQRLEFRQSSAEDIELSIAMRFLFVFCFLFKYCH